MNPRTLVTLDTTEKIHVFDVKSEEELEVSCFFIFPFNYTNQREGRCFNIDFYHDRMSYLEYS